MVAGAIGGGGARLTVRLLAAAPVLAGNAGDAVGVAGAAVDARAVLASEGRAVLHPGREAAADAVAGARHPAGRGRLGLTDAVRIGAADVDGPAAAAAALLVAADTGALA